MRNERLHFAGLLFLVFCVYVRREKCNSRKSYVYFNLETVSDKGLISYSVSAIIVDI